MTVFELKAGMIEFVDGDLIDKAALGSPNVEDSVRLVSETAEDATLEGRPVKDEHDLVPLDRSNTEFEFKLGHSCLPFRLGSGPEEASFNLDCSELVNDRRSNPRAKLALMKIEKGLNNFVTQVAGLRFFLGHKKHRTNPDLSDFVKRRTWV